MPEAQQVTTERKKPGPAPKHTDEQKYALRLPGELLKNLRAVAFLEGDSLNDVIVTALDAFWREHPRREFIEASQRPPAKRPRRQ